ncbi:MAG: glycogen synthase GlgA [Planctomycetaceae bacterium]
MVSSEAVPFAKTGGLADVVTGLSRALEDAGHQLTIILPHHRRFVPSSLQGMPTGRTIAVDMGAHTAHAWVRRALLPESRVDVLLVDHPGYFDRSGIYGLEGADYPDNAERFIFLSRAALELCQAFDLQPDILHVHDWQTSLIPALMAGTPRERANFARTASVLTLHNLAFQGHFPARAMKLTGLPDEMFRWDRLEFWGSLNLLKAGCVFADRLTTVSPNYAREITTPAYGWGLEGVLRDRGSDLVGILNGIDTDEWDPASDRMIPQRYDGESAERGKAVCKRELQRELGLDRNDAVPLIGLVSRLTDQKGLDLIAAGADALLGMEAQFVFLGGGDPRYEELVSSLSHRAPGRVASVVGYSEPLAHRIEAGSDIFLMPSRFEPCGLNQMYSLMYGTVPLVHAVGGLVDSVVNLSPQSLENGSATGFVFYDYSTDAFLGTVRWALETYRNRPVWRQLQQNGMRLDLSWRRSAKAYVDVYQAALTQRRGAPSGDSH